jgi:competence protein ComEA
MNKKERLAGAVLVLTLAVGILVDILEKGEEGTGIVETGVGLGAIVESDTSGEVPNESAEPDGQEAGPASPARDTGKAGGPAGRGDGEYRKIDLNTATLEELELLPGLGPKKAGAVIAWREEHGRFESVDALDNVKGIGKVTLERLAPYVCVGK